MTFFDKTKISQLFRLLSRHIGLGGDEAHPVADEWESGFMSPDMVTKYNRLFDKRPYTNANNSTAAERTLVDLPAGNYEGSGWIGHDDNPNPTSWVSEVDVTVGNDGKRKLIKVTDSQKSSRYHLNLHTGGVVSTAGWLRTLGTKVLYTGEFSTVGSSINLPRAYTSFDFVRVSFRYNGNHQTAIIKASDLNSVQGFSVANLSNSTNNFVNVGEIRIQGSSDRKSISVIGNKSLTVGANNISVDASPVVITMIEGLV